MASDCVLIYPRPSLDSPNRNLALGIMFVGAALEARGFEVTYLDLRYDKLELLRSELERGALSVGVSAMTGHQCAEAADIFSMVKSIAPKVKTILGGVHGSMLPLQTVADADIDFVVCGEGEQTICELVDALKGGTREYYGIAGLAWKDHGEPTLNPKREFMALDEVPFPLTPRNKRYFEAAARTRHLSYFTTRGCPFRCSFCYNVVFNDRRWRTLSPDRLSEDLARLRRSVAFDHVYVVDDYLGHRKKRVAEVTRVFRTEGLSWHSSIRPSDIDPEMAQILEEGNCTLVLFGIEAASKRIQQDILVKDYKGEDQIRECVQTMSRTRITGLYSFMYNVPGETPPELERSFKLAEWIYHTDRRARVGFYAYTPYPGTPLYDDALKTGFAPPTRLRDWSELSLSNELSAEKRDLYYIAGLRFRGRSGDRTNENFPGLSRALILPFELGSRWRWRKRHFVYTDFERRAVRGLIERASRRSR